MTTSPVVTITEDLVAELQSAATDSKLNIYRPFGWAHSVRCGNHLQTDYDYLSAVSPEVILALIAERAAMQSQIKAGIVTQDNLELYRKDALRYQWLREASHFDTPQHQAFCKAYGAALDEEIDQAMQEQQP